jgi:hypothetical protein
MQGGGMTPERAYYQQAYNARQRGISFELTFEQWWGIWERWFHMRGRGKNALCMARQNDEGPYAIGNVYLTTNLGNALDVKPERRKNQNANLSDNERIAMQQKKGRWMKGAAKFSPNGDLMSHIYYKDSCEKEENVSEY